MCLLVQGMVFSLIDTGYIKFDFSSEDTILQLYWRFKIKHFRQAKLSKWETQS